MLRKNLLQFIFSGASLWRWNDKLRPVQLTEIEKQAHKMLAACALWTQASLDMPLAQKADLGRRIIEGALFDYFFRMIITDIKPPVFYRIRKNRVHFEKLTRYALGRLEPILAPAGGFWERMRNWHLDAWGEERLERRILAASHLFASRWEFLLIRPHNAFDEEMDGIASSFEEELAAYADLPGMAQLLTAGNALARFGNLCGQLRFQIRWTQIPRIPATSVLGHMFIVAACAYMYSVSMQSGAARACNTFFSGLFHDFPELLTRDIISPVKQAIPELQEIIREHERAELERRVLGPLREDGFSEFAQRIAYYLGLDVGSEFRDCYQEGGRTIPVSGCGELALHDMDENNPKDGQLLKVCDLLAAFLEAHNSIRNGIASPYLLEARARIKNTILELAPERLNLGALLADFD